MFPVFFKQFFKFNKFKLSSGDLGLIFKASSNPEKMKNKKLNLYYSMKTLFYLKFYFCLIFAILLSFHIFNTKSKML